MPHDGGLCLPFILRPRGRILRFLILTVNCGEKRTHWEVIEMDEIGYSVDGHIASVQLLRPEKLNAMTDEMYLAIGEAFKEADANPDVRCVVLSGSGRAFTSGHDLLEFGERQAWKPWSGERFDNGLETAKPVIAAINGYCLAGGLELALYCDIRICDTTAQFGCPEPRWGILHGYGALRTPGLVGSSDAMRLLLTGEFIDAEEAYASASSARSWSRRS